MFCLYLFQTGTNISTLCDATESEGKALQPHLVSVGRFEDAAQQYVIVGKSDKVIIPLDEDLTGAVDKLFKVFWVCNLSYPPELSSVFAFLECVYNIPLSTTRKARVMDLISKMNSVQ